MADGRNQSCSCGSGKKAKRCCGVRRGPSEADLARAWLDVEARQHARRLLKLDEDELRDVFGEAMALPTCDFAFLLPLPRVLPPELNALREAFEEGTIHDVRARMPAALAWADSPQARKALAEAVLAGRDSGTVDALVAGAAIVDLASDGPSELLQASLIEALAIDAGAYETPSGLLVAAGPTPRLSV